MCFALVILAAGVSARFGNESKQSKAFGPNQETIMDYSIYDAIQVGFSEIILIVNKEASKGFIDDIKTKWSNKIKITATYQSLSDGFESKENSQYSSLLEKRLKPWGTAQALFCLEGSVHSPFAIINADDFYGRKSFSKALQFLSKETNKTQYGNIYYILKDTVSEYAELTRGVCEHDEKNMLTKINEYKKLKKTKDGIWNSAEKIFVNPESKVSMNFWCLQPFVISLLKNRFGRFLTNIKNATEDEFILPEVIGDLMKDGLCSVKMLHSESSWFGVTYQDDIPVMKNFLKQQIDNNLYPKRIYHL